MSHSSDPENRIAETRLAWLRAHQEAQRQLAETHRSFQSSMSELHGEYLRVMRASLVALDRVWSEETEPLATPPAAPSREAEASEAGDSEPESATSARPFLDEPAMPEPPPVPAASRSASEPEARRCALQEVPAPPIGLALAGLAGTSLVAVTDDGAGIAPALVEQLQARGVRAELAAEESSARAAGWILLGGLGAVDSTAVAFDVAHRAFDLARSVTRRFATGRGLFVTVQDTGGDFGLSNRSDERVPLGALAGLARAVSREWPAVTTRAIDCERGTNPPWKIAKLLAEELLAGGTELLVGLHADGRRTTLEYSTSHASAIADEKAATGSPTTESSATDELGTLLARAEEVSAGREEIRAALERAATALRPVIGSAAGAALAPFLGRAKEAPMLTMDAFVSAATHPHLEGHRPLGGPPLLPLSWALEWFSRVAKAHCPDLEMISCHDLSQEHPTWLEGFYDSGDAFTVVSQQRRRGTGCELLLELYARSGRLLATARAEMAPAGNTSSATKKTLRLLHRAHEETLEPWPFSKLYGLALFQGSEIQVVREIEGCAEDLVVAGLIGTREMGWQDAWRTDLAALEGGLQLAQLWHQYRNDEPGEGVALPMSLKAYNRYFSGLTEGPIRAVMTGRSGEDGVECDVVFANENGTLLAELVGVEVRRVADLEPPRIEDQSRLEPEVELDAGDEDAAGSAASEELPIEALFLDRPPEES